MTNINSNIEKKRGAILSFLTQFVHIVVAFSYTPIMLRIVGQEEYGLYQMTCAIMSYVGLLELGLSGAYMRFYAQCEKEKNNTAISRLNGLFLIFFLIIAVGCLISGMVIAKNIEFLFDKGLTIQECKRARILIYILTIGIVCEMICTIFRGYVIAYERFTFIKVTELLRNILNPLVALPLLLLGYGTVGMCVTTSCLTAGTLIAFIVYSFHKLKMKFSFIGITLAYAKRLISFSSFVLINQVNDLINWSLDNVLIARYCGTKEVALYSVAASINIIFRTLLSSISSLFIPQINRVIVIENDKNKADNIFVNVGKAIFILSSLIISGFILFGKEFILIWAGEGYEKSYYIGIIIMTAASMELIQFIGIEIQKARNMHQMRSFVYAIISVLNICVSIPLIDKYGSIGAAIGTGCSLFAGTWVFMNIYYHKKMGINMILYWKKVLRIFPSILLSFTLGILLKQMFVVENVIIIFCIVLYSILYGCAVYFIGLNKQDKEMIWKIIKQRNV